MTLALLAQTAAAPAPKTAFYTAVATIIPVLYIALAVQGHAGASLNNMANRLQDRKPARFTGLTALISHAADATAGLTAAAILIGGATAEILAIMNLYWGSLSSNSGPFVLWLTILLVAAVAAGPVLDYWRAQGRGTPAQPETGKTDPASR